MSRPLVDMRGLREAQTPEIDLRADADIIADLLTHKPVASEKNVWAFWDKGFTRMPPYLQRNVVNWARRLPSWTIRVLDIVPDSALNVSRHTEREDFPDCFNEGALDGRYAAVIMSDMVRIACLVAHGGVWMDVGILLFRDLDDICWREIEDAQSATRSCGFAWFQDDDYMIMESYFIACRKHDPFFANVKQVMLETWKGRTSTKGIVRHPLLLGSRRHSPFNFMGTSCPPHMEPGGELDGVMEEFSDYLFLCMSIDATRRMEYPGWSGAGYYRKHFKIMDARSENGLPHWKLDWDARRLWELWCLPTDTTSEDGKKAEELTMMALRDSCFLKLDHNEHMPLDHLGTLWKHKMGSDSAPGTWAEQLRYGSARYKQTRSLTALPPVALDKIGDGIYREQDQWPLDADVDENRWNGSYLI